MPFNYKAVIELRRRIGLSQTGLSNILNEYAEFNELKSKKIGKSLISRWERGIRAPNWDSLDLLYIVARDNECNDLEFYLIPKYKSLKKTE